MANISPGRTIPWDPRASSMTFPPDPFSPYSASLEFAFRPRNTPPSTGTTYPTSSHLTPIPPRCNMAGPPFIARLCASFPNRSKAKRAAMMVPTTAKPAITPPLSCCPDVAVEVEFELVAVSITDCATHSPKVQPDRESPWLPNKVRRSCWLNEQGVPEVLDALLDEELVQSISSVPESELMV